MRIGRRTVGPGQPTYIVAELSGNHGGDLNQALALVQAAKAAGADAIKLQTFTPDTMTLPLDTTYFSLADTPWADRRTLYDLYRETHTPWEWHAPLQAEAHRLGMDMFSSPFDATAVDFLETLNVPAYKVASFEVGDFPLLRRIAQTHKPVLLSTGMAPLPLLTEAVAWLRQHGAGPLCLLKCTSAYPAPLDAANVRTIPDMAQRFQCLAGLSDHTPGWQVPMLAAAVGAAVIEKHLKLEGDDAGADSAFSLTPSEFAAMVAHVRTAAVVLGSVAYAQPKVGKYVHLTRSLFVTQDVRPGQPVTPAVVRSIRPGHGLAPKCWDLVQGARFATAVDRGTPLAWDHLLTLRRATVADGERLREWANDPTTVRWSRRRQGPVGLEEHMSWLRRQLADPAVHLYVAGVREAVGCIRLDPAGLHLTVAPAYRGYGLGRALVTRLLALHPERPVVAEVHQDNVASGRVFAACGFRPVMVNGVWLTYVKE